MVCESGCKASVGTKTASFNWLSAAGNWAQRTGAAFSLCVALALFSTPSSLHAADDAPFRAQFGVHTPMRDGINLSSDIWMPSVAGRYPSILVRVPYEKEA
jgi:predicted acyl esterase